MRARRNGLHSPIRPRLAILVLVLTALAACGRSQPTAPSSPETPACTPAPGVVCFGRQNYVEYAAGALPIVLSVPHGGTLTPATIPDRTVGTTVRDTNTIELGRAVSDAFAARTGSRPHLAIVHLRRTKLDANRELGEAAQGNAEAAQAWTEYHGFIESAITDVVGRHGSGFYVDLHGHGHAIARLELGYLLSSAQLNQSDPDLDASGLAASSSLARAMAMTAAPFSEVLRGPTSLGGLLAPIPSVPSPAAPSPDSDPYFSGGYSTSRHTTRIPGLQIESHFAGLRDSAASRAAFGDALVTAILEFGAAHRLFAGLATMHVGWHRASRSTTSSSTAAQASSGDPAFASICRISPDACSPR